jgi:hypothetical protein
MGAGAVPGPATGAADVLEAAVDVLDEEAWESVLGYVRFQVAQAKRKSKS